MQEYLWLEELHSEKSLAWVNEQNERTLKHLKSYHGFNELYQTAYANAQTDVGVSLDHVFDGFVYHVQKNQANPIGRWVRAPIEQYQGAHFEWEVLLDLDQYAKEMQLPYYLQQYQFSPNKQRCLLFLSERGMDRTVKREFDINTKSFVENGFSTVCSKAGASWFDDDTLICADPEQMNDLGYPRILKVWKRGQRWDQTQELFVSEKSSMGLWSFPIKNKYRLIGESIVWGHSHFYLVTDELKLQRLFVPPYVNNLTIINDEIIFFLHKDFAALKAGKIFSVSLEQAINNKNPDYQVLLENSTDEFIQGFSDVGEGILVYKNKNVASTLSLGKKNNNQWVFHEVVTPPASQIVTITYDQSCNRTFVGIESFSEPKQIFELNSDLKLLPFKKADLPASDVRVEQYWTVSKDGVRVPYYVVCNKDLDTSQPQPTLLYSYGGFFNPLLPTYGLLIKKLWIEKGGVYVVANIRGGSEFGEAWHKAAILKNKQKSYDDFIAVAEDLIARKITSPEHLGIRGGSNGGLLMGAVTMQRPELFKAVSCEMPLLDMMRYAELPPGGSWKEEFGDPADPEMREVILKYSPMQNVKADKKYPHIFFKTAISDDRVHPSHARRMVARMQELGHPVWLYEAQDGGHNSGDLEQAALSEALRCSYLWSMLAKS